MPSSRIPPLPPFDDLRRFGANAPRISSGALEVEPSSLTIAPLADATPEQMKTRKPRITGKAKRYSDDALEIERLAALVADLERRVAKLEKKP